MRMKMPLEEVCWIRRGNSDYYSLLQNIIPSFAGRNAMAKLEARIRELETELGNVQAMIRMSRHQYRFSDHWPISL